MGNHSIVLMDISPIYLQLFHFIIRMCNTCYVTTSVMSIEIKRDGCILKFLFAPKIEPITNGTLFLIILTR